MITPITSIVALCGALLILTIFSLMDFYAVTQCFSLAHKGITGNELCSPEHLFRTSIEIAGMGIGLYGVYGVSKVLGKS